MIINAKVGQKVKCIYKDRNMPLRNKVGVVVISSKGKPRNHGVLIDGKMYVVPCGNLIEI